MEVEGRRQLYGEKGIKGLQPFGTGQLITADDLNELVDAIKELDRRLAAVEACCDKA